MENIGNNKNYLLTVAPEDAPLVGAPPAAVLGDGDPSPPPGVCL